MPLLVRCFDTYPTELESDLARIYSDDPAYKGLGDQALTTIKNDFDDPSTRLYAAQFNGRWLAAGIVTGEKNREIRSICVRNMSRQQGIGRKLLNEIKRLELQQGCDALFTCIESSNPAAQAFLRSLDLIADNTTGENAERCYSLLTVNLSTD